MRPMIDAMAAPDDPEDLAAEEEEEEEVEGEEAADFGREEADFELFAAEGLVCVVRIVLGKTGGGKRAGRDGEGTYPEWMQHQAAIMPVRAPLAPKEVVMKLLVMTKRPRETNEATTPLDR